MASEILAVPEEHLQEVITVIRYGLGAAPQEEVTDGVRDNLRQWCSEEEDYLKVLAE